MAKGVRLDKYLVDQGLVETRSKAQALIMAGKVLLGGAPATKAGQPVTPGAAVLVKSAEHPYVSRGGLKLEGALKDFSFDPTGMKCLDLGASTGGFTDCLLMHGATSVTALDVGYGQIAWKLRSDDRVEVIERVNARNLPDDVAPGPYDLITADVSFISLSLIIPNIPQRLKTGGYVILLVKPQFEAGPRHVAKGGVVKDPEVRKQCVDKISRLLDSSGFNVRGSVKSPIKGPAGNQEYLLLAQKA